MPKIYTFKIRQNTAYFEKYGKIRQNTDRIQVIGNCTKSDKKLYPSPVDRGEMDTEENGMEGRGRESDAKARG